MNHKINFETVVNRFEENGLEYAVLDIGDDVRIICSRLGGRIFGPFETKNSESIMWINGAFESQESFQKFLKAKDWNLGGDRVWVLPEMPFFVEKRTDFYNTYVVQPELDPGDYELINDDDSVVLRQNVSINTFELECCKHKDFFMQRKIRKAQNPLRNLQNYGELMEQVKFCGFEQEIILEDNSEDTSLYLEAWLLSQINPRGSLIVPMNGSKELVDYYEPMEENMCITEEAGVRLSVTGETRYKIGFLSSQVTGKSGYMGKTSDGRSYLFIRNYYNNPSSVYCGDPFDRPGLFGCSLFFYNGHTAQGGFSEYEHSCNTISGDTGKRESQDTCQYYFFIGSEDKLRDISKELLGM